MQQTDFAGIEHQTSPKYFVDIEGHNFPWAQDTITTEQIAQLGGWDLSEARVSIAKDNNERPLKPAEAVKLMPGQGFAKKVRFRRG